MSKVLIEFDTVEASVEDNEVLPTLFISERTLTPGKRLYPTSFKSASGTLQTSDTGDPNEPGDWTNVDVASGQRINLADGVARFVRLAGGAGIIYLRDLR